MATITVRNLPDSVVEALKALAERNSRSMEQEAREIISSHVMDRKTVVQLMEQGWKRHKRAIGLEEAEDWVRQSRAWRQ